jgi:glutathione peroxidase-family protein
MHQWGLQTEPWTFLVSRDGRIEAKFEGSISAEELETAIRRLLL